MGFFHFDMIGFIRLGQTRVERFKTLVGLLQNVMNDGGNIYVPSYTYSFTQKQVFSIKNSPTTLGPAFEILRQNFYNIRTADPLFSYLAFSQKTPHHFFTPSNYETFGQNSLIADAYKKNGILISVGNRLHYSTEIHFIEKKIGVPYRFDKVFPGQIEALDGKLHNVDATYYCRDLDFAQKNNLTVSFELLMDELRSRKIIKQKNIRDEFFLEWVELSEVEAFIAERIKQMPHYLMKPDVISS